MLFKTSPPPSSHQHQRSSSASSSSSTASTSMLGGLWRRRKQQATRPRISLPCPLKVDILTANAGSTFSPPSATSDWSSFTAVGDPNFCATLYALEEYTDLCGGKAAKQGLEEDLVLAEKLDACGAAMSKDEKRARNEAQMKQWDMERLLNRDKQISDQLKGLGL